MSDQLNDQDAMPWLSDDLPHDPERSEAQIAGVVKLLDGAPKRVLDLGCGSGRTLVPLARAGHTMVGIDSARRCLDSCAQQLTGHLERTTLIAADFLEPWPDLAGPFDAVCCLGNTFMTVHDVADAAHLLERVAIVLAPGGLFIIDDCPHDFWMELTEGNWRSGMSEDGAMQMVWEPGDAVFAIRTGEAVDPDSWRPTESDQRLRLWSLGALRLLAASAGLSAAEHQAASCVLIMRRTALPTG